MITGPSGVGKENYDWYLKHVLLSPWTFDQQVIILQRELDRSLAALHGQGMIAIEGLVQTIAQEVAAARAMGTGYGAGGHAMTGDGRAVTFNRTA